MRGDNSEITDLVHHSGNYHPVQSTSLFAAAALWLQQSRAALLKYIIIDELYDIQSKHVYVHDIQTEMYQFHICV